MKYQLPICGFLAIALTASSAQMASHTPTAITNTASAQTSPLQVSDKPVARVNGAVLTDRDLLREMYAIFPYAQQHNGFPKAQEAGIRQGALEMIIFEELGVSGGGAPQACGSSRETQSGGSRVSKTVQQSRPIPAILAERDAWFRATLRQQIRRSLLIEQMLKTEVELKDTVTPAEMQTYYAKNAARFSQPETFTFQSISIVPPLKDSPEQAKQARTKAEDALRQAKATKSYQDFGLLAEKISEDDFRVNMGDHKAVSSGKLPPQVVKAFKAMQSGQVSGMIQIESAFTILRLNAHTPPRTKPFSEVKTELKQDLLKSKYEKLRSKLAKQLRAKAKIEVV